MRALEWIAPTAEELSATASAIDPEAGAEILYRVRQIDDSEYGSANTDEYIRIKVFDERGVRQLDKIDIHYGSLERISRLQARVIKPNGTIINVGKRAFYDRNVAKHGDMKIKVRSFSFPQLEPGDIAEYKWQINADRNVLVARFLFLGEMPSRRVVFRLKAAPLPMGYVTKAFFHKCAEQKPDLDKKGFDFIEMRDLPAFVSESYMESKNDVQPWMLFYPALERESPEAYWKEVARGARSGVEYHAKKPSKLVRQTAERIVGDASDSAEKLARINDYCRENIVNYAVYPPDKGVDEKIIWKRNRSPDELIKSKLGNSDDIPVLFIALARAQGLDARIALCSNSRDGLPVPVKYYASELFVAVKINDAWQFYDPSHKTVPSGMLRWRNEGVPAMVVLPKGSEWVVTKPTPASRSILRRTAKLRVDDEGTLHGDVRIEYSGQSEITARDRFHSETQQKIEEMVKDEVQGRLSNAEVSEIQAVNANDVLKPLALSYKVKVPGYAENTGRRFFIQPNFFEKGTQARFAGNERRHNMFFSYGETIKDEISMQLPGGFRLEEGSAPATIKPGNWGHYNVSIAMKQSENNIIYERVLVFRPRQVPVSNYKAVKAIFDIVHMHDSHVLTFLAGE